MRRTKTPVAAVMFSMAATTAATCLGGRRARVRDLAAGRRLFPASLPPGDGTRSGHHRPAVQATPARSIEVRERSRGLNIGRVELLDPAAGRDPTPDRAADGA